MKVLCLDSFGCALDWVFRVQNAGHEVKWYMELDDENKSPKIGEGFGIEKVAAWKPWMKWADLIVLTGNSKWMDELEPYWKKGFPIFGPNKAATKLEQDRHVGLDLLHKLGISVVPYETFKTVPEAEKFILANPKKVYAVKPSGDTGVSRTMSHVAKSADDLIYTLRDWEKRKCLPEEFLLQEKIDGIEVGVGGWFGPGGWSKWWEENFEFKKLMAGDIGPNCDEQGTVMRYTKESKLADMLLEPLTEYLHSIDYVGNIDVNCIVDEKGVPWPLEFTCRLGWPAFCIQQRIHRGDPVEWMLGLLQGKDMLKAKEEIVVGISCNQSDYPYNLKDVKEIEGKPLYHLEEVWENVHPQKLMCGKYPTVREGKIVQRDGYLSAGTVLFVATGLGKTVCQAEKAAMKIVKSVDFPNDLLYRNDIGERLQEQLPALQKHGFVKGMLYE